MLSRIDLERTGATTQVMAQQTRNVAGLVTKRRTDQVAATRPMSWIESNWAYDTPRYRFCGIASLHVAQPSFAWSTQGHCGVPRGETQTIRERKAK